MEKDVQYNLRFNKHQDNVIRLYQRLCGYESAPQMIKQFVLDKVKKISSKIDLSIRRLERKIGKMEIKFGSKVEAIKSEEYKGLLILLDKLIKSKDYYETVIFEFFPSPDPIKCILDCQRTKELIGYRKKEELLHVVCERG